MNWKRNVKKLDIMHCTYSHAEPEHLTMLRHVSATLKYRKRERMSDHLSRLINVVNTYVGVSATCYTKVL